MTQKEMRLIALAVKNSLLETKLKGNSGDAEEMPVFKPTAEQFKNPISYIEHLISGPAKIGQYGCIKIKPPPGFKPTLAFDTKSDRKLPTRYQVL